MPEAPSILSIPKPVRWIAISLLILVGAFAGWKMLNLPLWGWWPLVLILSLWLAGTLFFYPKVAVERKWLAAATLSGVLLGLGFPPSPLTWVVFVAWIPL